MTSESCDSSKWSENFFSGKVRGLKTYIEILNGNKKNWWNKIQFIDINSIISIRLKLFNKKIFFHEWLFSFKRCENYKIEIKSIITGFWLDGSLLWW